MWRFLLGLLFLGAGAAFCGEPEKSVLEETQYKRGMSIEDVQKLTSKVYRPSTSGRLVDDENPAPNGAEAESEVRYVMRIPDENLSLYFNWNGKLIGARRPPGPKPQLAKESSSEVSEKHLKQELLRIYEQLPLESYPPWVQATRAEVEKKVCAYDPEAKVYRCGAWTVDLQKGFAILQGPESFLEAKIERAEGVLRLVRPKLWKTMKTEK